MNFEEAVERIIHAVKSNDRKKLIKETVLDLSDRSKGGDSLIVFYAMIEALTEIGNEIYKDRTNGEIKKLQKEIKDLKEEIKDLKELVLTIKGTGTPYPVPMPYPWPQNPYNPVNPLSPYCKAFSLGETSVEVKFE